MATDILTKTCSKCKLTKSVSEFSTDRSSMDGLYYRCRECNASYYKNNKDKIKSRVKTYSKANKDIINDKKLIYRAAHKEQRKAWYKRYREENKEKIAIGNKLYYEKNKARIADQLKSYHKNNRDRILARVKSWSEVNPEKIKAWRDSHHDVLLELKRVGGHRRRARKLNAGGSHTRQEIQDLMVKQRGKCVYCKTKIDKSYHADHIVALAKGGNDHITNIQLLCPTCNMRKNARDNIEFAQSLGLLL